MTDWYKKLIWGWTTGRKCNVAYFAGLFDGEGSINIITPTGSRYAWALSCAVKMTNSRELMAEMKAAFGGNTGEKWSYRRNGNKPQYYWQVRARLAGKFLAAVYPFLRVKKEEAEVAIRFQQTIRTSRGARHLTEEETSFRMARKLELEALR